MKIIDLLTNDKESCILALNLLGDSFIQFLKINLLVRTAELIKICLENPSKIYIIERGILVPYDNGLLAFDWLGMLIYDYENFRTNKK